MRALYDRTLLRFIFQLVALILFFESKRTVDRSFHIEYLNHPVCDTRAILY